MGSHAIAKAKAREIEIIYGTAALDRLAVCEHPIQGLWQLGTMGFPQSWVKAVVATTSGTIAGFREVSTVS
jgi:hypothetical protein